MGKINWKMKLFRIFIAIAIIAIVSSALKTDRSRSRNHNLNHIIEKRTLFNNADKGKIFLLERHDLTCPQNSAMSYFLYHRFGQMFQYRYNCVSSDAISSLTYAKHTAWNDINTGLFSSYSLLLLQKHLVRCEEGEVLQQFQLERNSTKDKIRYRYTCVKAQTVCCKDYKTSASHNSGKKSFALDKQPVGIKSTNNSVLKEFRLWAHDNNDLIWFTYRLCKLKDMQAENKVIELKNQIRTDTAELEAGELELEAAKHRIQALKTKLADNQSNLSLARQDPGLNC